MKNLIERNFFKNIYNFIKLVKILRNWKEKYEPSDYDRVINDAFVLIDGYGLKPGEISPSFTLPDSQLDEDFIKKFFETAKSHGYKVNSNDSKNGYTTFNFTR